jgi:hypothetical protein
MCDKNPKHLKGNIPKQPLETLALDLYQRTGNFMEMQLSEGEINCFYLLSFVIRYHASLLTLSPELRAVA